MDGERVRHHAVVEEEHGEFVPVPSPVPFWAPEEPVDEGFYRAVGQSSATPWADPIAIYRVLGVQVFLCGDGSGLQLLKQWTIFISHLFAGESSALDIDALTLKVLGVGPGLGGGPEEALLAGQPFDVLDVRIDAMQEDPVDAGDCAVAAASEAESQSGVKEAGDGAWGARGAGGVLIPDVNKEGSPSASFLTCLRHASTRSLKASE